MGAQNGHTVHDAIINGYKRKVIELNNNGSLGVSIPQKYVDENDINKSDPVAIVEENGRLSLEFGNNE